MALRHGMHTSTRWKGGRNTESPRKIASKTSKKAEGGITICEYGGRPKKSNYGLKRRRRVWKDPPPPKWTGKAQAKAGSGHQMSSVEESMGV